MEKQKAIRITGAWTREGKYGKFVVSTIKLAELQEALASFGNLDEFELIMSPVREKTSESSPDYNINIRPRYPIQSNEGAKTMNLKKTYRGNGGGGNKPPVAVRTF